jgi:alpha-beta hydrolase superfamily lysophospholipase
MLDPVHLSRIHVPALVVHGKDDTIIPPESSQELYDQLGSDDKTLRFFDKAYHEIHNEECAEELYEVLIDWMKAHIPSPQ